MSLVVRRLTSFDICDQIIVATDSPRVLEVVDPTTPVILTDADHSSGTERVAEVIDIQEFMSYDLILNLQCDEPFVPREAVVGAVDRVRAGDAIGTAGAPLPPGAMADPHRVKVLVDARGHARHFTRQIDPADVERDQVLEHVGIYAYTRDALLQWVSYPSTTNERAERLEQLRPLDYDMTIGVAGLSVEAPRGIDTEDDLRWAREHVNRLVGGEILT